MRFSSICDWVKRQWFGSTSKDTLNSKVAACSAFLAIAIAAGGAQAGEEYVPGPQDTLKIRVYEWRPSTMTAFEWAPLSGEFVVSSAGNLSLPIIGTVPVSGKTLEQISETIGQRLQSEVGLQKRPSASVEISSYRPLFVTGLVATPGKYNYNPGLTVIQALSMAGGIGSTDANVIGLQRDALSSRGQMRELEAERLGLLARQARVDAVLSGASSVTFPAELVSKAKDPRFSRMMEEEQSLFETRERSMMTEIDALNRAKVLANNQIAALKEKSASLAKQIELAGKDLNSVNKLVSQGLTVTARQLGANQNVAELESRNLDVSLATLKTEQDLAKVDQDIADVHNRYRVNALTEAAELRDRFASNAEKAKTEREQLKNLQIRAPSAIASIAEEKDPFTFLMTINRVVDGSMRTLVVNDNDPVLPGDVIRVEQREEQSAAVSDVSSN
ncbi:polysaccharide biosynthesis/export family protein [Rhizobium mesoamericanum]|uniref:Exopolysaccharide biosynthesis protein (OMA family outer membrane saccharide export protein) n=1 Tax=Rhizobium mesoamericanum STM3625 TaxID=1211777 RepID=K0Q2C6_9HYPH|nr:polysaccharide biosynthesis/export family protein [Rhizobium mesoamericanum]CCM78312.1 Exopolysaccharide biosynthesis protein (OMA family outer membrane saccharide export protein) [Rhizobium mesoamericanum STM3625]